jgi:hypothetical protein
MRSTVEGARGERRAGAERSRGCVEVSTTHAGSGLGAGAAARWESSRRGRSLGDCWTHRVRRMAEPGGAKRRGQCGREQVSREVRACCAGGPRRDGGVKRQAGGRRAQAARREERDVVWETSCCRVDRMLSVS